MTATIVTTVQVLFDGSTQRHQLTSQNRNRLWQTTTLRGYEQGLCHHRQSRQLSDTWTLRFDLWQHTTHRSKVK